MNAWNERFNAHILLLNIYWTSDFFDALPNSRKLLFLWVCHLVTHRFLDNRAIFCWTWANTWSFLQMRGRNQSSRTKIQLSIICNLHPAPPNNRVPFHHRKKHLFHCNERWRQHLRDFIQALSMLYYNRICFFFSVKIQWLNQFQVNWFILILGSHPRSIRCKKNWCLVQESSCTLS